MATSDRSPKFVTVEDHMTERHYRIYIDESGDHTFRQSDVDNHRYLGLIGVWFEQETHYKSFHRELERFKVDVFGPHPDDEPICLHRKDIVERRGVFGLLRDPARNMAFETGLTEVMVAAKFRIGCVVLDKNVHETKTYRQLFHPYHYCLASLLERYAGWLELIGGKGDVMAEARGCKEDKLLEESFENTLAQGTRFHSAARFQAVLTSGKLKLKTKRHNIAGLQLADLLAYPLRREMVLESRQESLVKEDFSSALLNAVRHRINCHRSTGQVAGYGKVWLS